MELQSQDVILHYANTYSEQPRNLALYTRLFFMLDHVRVWHFSLFMVT